MAPEASPGGVTSSLGHTEGLWPKIPETEVKPQEHLIVRLRTWPKSGVEPGGNSIQSKGKATKNNSSRIQGALAVSGLGVAPAEGCGRATPNQIGSTPPDERGTCRFAGGNWPMKIVHIEDFLLPGRSSKERYDGSQRYGVGPEKTRDRALWSERAAGDAIPDPQGQVSLFIFRKSLSHGSTRSALSIVK